MVPLSMCFSLVQDKEHARSLPFRHNDWFDLHKKTARYIDDANMLKKIFQTETQNSGDRVNRKLKSHTAVGGS